MSEKKKFNLKNLFKPKATYTNEQEYIQWVVDNFGSESTSGINISSDNAMKVSAVYSCVKIISNQIAQLPMCVYQNTAAGRIRARNHPIDRLVHTAYNEYLISYYGLRPAIVNLLLTGSGYIMITRQNGAPVELWPVNSKRVRKEINGKGRPRYIVDFDKEGTVTVPYTDMIELQGISKDGKYPYDPVKLFANMLGLLKAAETYSADYFKNATAPSGIVEVPIAMTDEAYERFKKSVEDAHSSLGNKHKMMILEDGAKFNKITNPPEDGQTIEARRFQIIEVARFFNMPPTKMMDYEGATWGNLEEVNAAFLNDCLMEYIRPIEQLFTMQLLTEKEKSEGFYIEFNIASLLRGKMSERYEAYAKARQWGFESVNEIREKENMSNIGAQGDIYLTPANMINSEDLK